MTASGGCIIRNSRSQTEAGTFGCLVKRRGDSESLFILSAGHVLGLNGYAMRGDPIIFHVSGDRTGTQIGEFEEFVAFRDIPGVYHTCDAAIARVTNPALVSAEIMNIGTPRGIATALYQGMPVQYCGAKTGLSKIGAVHSSGNEVMILYNGLNDESTFTLNFRDQIFYGKLSTGTNLCVPITQQGDSGALVLTNDLLAIGLHLGVTPLDYPIQASVCTPIAIILDTLNLELVTASPELVGATPLRSDRADSLYSASVDVDSIGERSLNDLGRSIRSLFEPHNIFAGCTWQLSLTGLIVANKLDYSPGRAITVPKVYQEFKSEIAQSATEFSVPTELIVATICTESSGRSNAVRIEPGWTSDQSTPSKISVGLMQTLISTAREALQNNTIDRNWLLDPANSIRAGTAYIHNQARITNYDPPKVACAYNAGSLIENTGNANRWRMKQFPIGTSEHADRFVLWFNDCFKYFRLLESQGEEIANPSFYNLIHNT